MNEATLALLVSSVLMLSIFGGLLAWGIKSGQFKNTEEAKYHVFRSDREAGTGRERETTEAAPPKEDEQHAP